MEHTIQNVRDWLSAEVDTHQNKSTRIVRTRNEVMVRINIEDVLASRYTDRRENQCMFNGTYDPTPMPLISLWEDLRVKAGRVFGTRKVFHLISVSYGRPNGNHSQIEFWLSEPK